MQGAIVDHDVDGEPVGLEIVGHVVLRRRRHATGLHRGHVGRREFAAEQRVLAHALEVPSAVRRPVEVDRRSEHDIDALAARLGGQGHAVPGREIAAPGRRQRRRRREVERRFPLVPPLATNAARAVGHQQIPQPDALDRDRVPEVAPGEKGDLLLEREARGERRDRFRDSGHRITLGLSGSTRESTPRILDMTVLSTRRKLQPDAGVVPRVGRPGAPGPGRGPPSSGVGCTGGSARC